MPIAVIYFLIIFCASTIGSISGMGGGVIIKPALDFIGYHSLSSITFYSSVAVLTMAFSSTYKQYKNGVQLTLKKALALSLGSLVGGVLGDRLLNGLLVALPSQKSILIVQYVLMLLTLLLVLLYNQYSTFHFSFTSIGIFLFVGLFLGALSTFLGIGGGPINVACLVLFFGMDIKAATVYSIVTIFFSQIAKLLTIALTSGFQSFDLTLLWAIIPAALLGGYLGGVLSKKFTPQHVAQLYKIVVCGVILLNGYNLWLILHT